MLTRFIRRQLVIFGILTAVALLVLGVYYLRLPSLAGIGQYDLRAELPASAGLYPRSNVTYRGITIGKVTSVEPTEKGAEATMSISSQYKIPLDSVANVHSVSAVGEQYLDLVSEGQGHVTELARPRAGHRQPVIDGVAEGQDRPTAGRDGRISRWSGPGAATTRRLHPGDRRRLQDQHQSGRRHHPELGADLGQPGRLQ